MRVHVVSDVHGNAEALARAGDGADALVVLGDLVEFVDYADPTRGILGRVLGPEVSARFGAAARRGAAGGAAARSPQEAWSRFPDPSAVVAEAVREQYAALFAAMPTPTFAIPGNVDLAELWPEFTRPGVCRARRAGRGDRRTAVRVRGRHPAAAGRRAAPAAARGPRTCCLAEEYAAAVEGLGPVDVLCSHAPPAVPELAYDVVSRRSEAPSTALLARIRRDRPRAAVFGHVHQPLAPRCRVGRTECVNVGHFRHTATPYVLRW